MVSNDRSLKRKDDGALEDAPTKRVRTTNDDQLASEVSDEGDSLSQGVPVPQLPKVEARSEDTNRAEEHGPAGKSSDDDEASGEADTAFVEEDTDSEDASDETSSSESDDNSEEEEGGEDDELSDLLSGGLPRPESHFCEKEPSDYEELLVERFHDEWEIASKTLLNRRLTDAFDDKSLWHGHYIRLISDQYVSFHTVVFLSDRMANETSLDPRSVSRRLQRASTSGLAHGSRTLAFPRRSGAQGYCSLMLPMCA